ncbi:hypothetical protein [Texcoconibacillus texcoconensis]|uniref:Uncharacterized protein n=1 Tax=Texcoconibacillus texcoconensis TaxID=1095777 RepID=A0A840QN17_9BACI|nr:hypothetical protein [Texcoconibacillus texcoconensis]MBB5172733.1 hypothetical protein [Texcoconibacillus texcoconensis]
MVISPRRLAKEKVNNLLAGYSAYSETEEVSTLIKRECHKLNVDVMEETSSTGSWFIPKERFK